MNSQKIRFVVAFLVVGLLGYTIGVTKIALDWRNFQPQVQIASKEPPSSIQHADFSQFWNVLEKLESNYYDKKAIDSQKILNGAIEGMIQSVDDPYTVYLPPQQNNSFKDSLAGRFEGIGAELGLKGKQIIVVAPLDGSPSQKAGVKAGDAVLKVDGQTTAGWTLNQTVDKIRGPKGTQVILSVVHKENTQPIDIKITRDTITVKSITSWTKEVKDIDGVAKSSFASTSQTDKVVYIRLSQFGDSTNQEWQTIATTVARQLQADKSIKGIVFDLRNNPGGYLTDAVYIASEFIKDGVAVKQEDRAGEKTSYNVSGKGVLTDVPVVVLINKGSASASEIVAGALRDHSRAELVGETSFGKGTIQQAEDLGGGAGLHITIAKWLTPNETWVGNGKNGSGLTPDVAVAVDTKDPSHDVQLEKAIGELLK